MERRRVVRHEPRRKAKNNKRSILFIILKKPYNFLSIPTSILASIFITRTVLPHYRTPSAWVLKEMPLKRVAFYSGVTFTLKPLNHIKLAASITAITAVPSRESLLFF